MGGLCDISSMKVIMIWNVFDIVILKSHQKIDHCASRNLEVFQQLSLLQKRINNTLVTIFYEMYYSFFVKFF